jgi:hypothetical protein
MRTRCTCICRIHAVKRRRRDLKECAEDAFGGPKYLSFLHSSISEVSRTRCTRLHSEGAHVVLAGFNESAQDRAQNAFFRPFLRFFAWAQCDGNPLILCSPWTRAHNAHVLGATVLSRIAWIKRIGRRCPRDARKRPSFAILGLLTRSRRNLFPSMPTLHKRERESTLHHSFWPF